MKTPTALRQLAVLTALALLLFGRPLEAAPVHDGIAAVVNGEIVTFYEIDTDPQYLHDDAQARAAYHGDELAAHVKQLKLETLDRLIDDRLIIQSFEQLGRSFPDSYLDGQIQQVIDQQYGGSENRFEIALVQFGETREEFRERINDYAIVVWMTSQNVDKKVTPPAAPDAASQRATLGAAWLGELRTKACIEKMP